MKIPVDLEYGVAFCVTAACDCIEASAACIGMFFSAGISEAKGIAVKTGESLELGLPTVVFGKADCGSSLVLTILGVTTVD